MASLGVLRLLLTYNVTAGPAKMFRDRLDVRSQSQCKSRSVTLVPFPRAWYIRKPNLIAIGYVLFAMLMATYLWVMMARENRRREEMVTNSKGNALLEGYERRFRLGDRSIYSTLNQPESRCHRVFSSRCDPTAFPGLRKGDL